MTQNKADSQSKSPKPQKTKAGVTMSQGKADQILLHISEFSKGLGNMEATLQNQNKTLEDAKKDQREGFDSVNLKLEKLQTRFEVFVGKAAEKAELARVESEFKQEISKINKELDESKTFRTQLQTTINIFKFVLGILSAAILTGIGFVIRNA